MSRTGMMFIDCFSAGWFSIQSLSGKQGLFFEDSDQFGPSKIDMRKDALDFIPEKHWFWQFYQPWRDAGRPTTGAPITTPHGSYLNAIWAPPTSPKTPEGNGQ